MFQIHRQELHFDENCKVVIVNRMIEQNMDYRFNNNLQIACKTDITKFCSEVIGIKSIFKLGRHIYNFSSRLCKVNFVG